MQKIMEIGGGEEKGLLSICLKLRAELALEDSGRTQ
jgi:hypothetical protein